MLFSAITLLAMPLLALAAPQVIDRKCGNPEASQEIKDMHHYLHSNEHNHTELISPDHFKSYNHTKRSTITIQTWFHVVASTSTSTSGQKGYISNTMIQNQLNYMNSQHANTSIQFSIAGTDRTVNNTWAANGDDTAMKTKLRKGTYQTLNIYLQSGLVQPGTSNTILGFCTLPTSGTVTAGSDREENTTDSSDLHTRSTASTASYISDGCNILSSTITGGTLTGYNLGGTTVHEVGHWHGLLHTFEGNTCTASASGDYISDTPQESVATSGCPALKNSCTSDAGLDPIHNFMDYSQDSCYQGFTPGQAARMVNMWNTYRSGK